MILVGVLLSTVGRGHGDRAGEDDLRHGDADRRHRLRRHRHGHLRLRRDLQEPRGSGTAQRHAQHDRAALAVAEGVARELPRDGARDGDRLHPRRSARERRHPRTVRQLRGGEARLQASAGLRQGRAAGRRRAGVGQQRRRADLVHPAPDPGPAAERGDGADGGGDDDPGHRARTAGHRAQPRPLLGSRRLDVDRQPDARHHQPAADRPVGEASVGALPAALPGDRGLLLHRSLLDLERARARDDGGDLRPLRLRPLQAPVRGGAARPRLRPRTAPGGEAPAGADHLRRQPAHLRHLAAIARACSSSRPRPSRWRCFPRSGSPGTRSSRTPEPFRRATQARRPYPPATVPAPAAPRFAQDARFSRGAAR